MLDERVTVLQTIDSNPYCVTEIVQRLRWKTKKTISLLKAMEREGLIDLLESTSSRKKGRPKKVATITLLGKELLRTFAECKKNIIQINENDIRSVVHQVSLRKRLQEQNISPYQRFFELNELAFRIRNSVIHEVST